MKTRKETRMKMINQPYTYKIQVGDFVLACPDTITSGYDVFCVTEISTDEEPTEPLIYWGCNCPHPSSSLGHKITPEEIVEIYPKAQDKPHLEFFEHDKTWRVKE